MLNRALACAAIVISIGSSVVTWMNRPPKIAYAETSVLLSQFSEAIQAKKQFEEAQKEWDKNLKQINDSLISAMNRMKAGYDKASAKEREDMQGVLSQRNSDLQRYTNAVKKMSEEKEKALMEPVIGKVNAFLDTWGKQHGYDLILGALTGGNILQANSNLNVTARIVHDINLYYGETPASPGVSSGKLKAGAKPDSSVVPKGI
jgi:outer membrane protein